MAQNKKEDGEITFKKGKEKPHLLMDQSTKVNICAENNMEEEYSQTKKELF